MQSGKVCAVESD